MPSTKLILENQCHINDEVNTSEIARIHSKVCDNSSLELHSDNKYYCFLHLPDNDKDEKRFDEIFKEKLNFVKNQLSEIKDLPDEEKEKAKDNISYDFSYVWFSSSVNFANYIFEVRANFDSAIFNQNVDFMGAIFEKRANFTWAEFYLDTFFDDVKFYNSADFNSAFFAGNSDILFRRTIFKGIAEFRYVTFSGFVSFTAPNNELNFQDHSYLDLQYARLESPEKISFHSVSLCPGWFINVDSKQFVFTDVIWRELNNVESKVQRLKDRNISAPYRLLGIAYRQLSVNAEENNRYEEASKFRYSAMNTRRLESWRGWLPFSLQWWYWAVSLYGESWQRALTILIAILLIFTIYYHSARFYICPSNTDNKTYCVIRSMDWGEAAHQSLMTGALQNIDYRKTTTSAEDIIILAEKILAPLQAALLALAIRRKFMR